MLSISIRFLLELVHRNAGIFFDANSVLIITYKSPQDVYCLRCCKKLKSKPEEPIKYSFYTLKWHHGYATSHLMKHINQYHAADIPADHKSASAAQSSTQQSKLTASSVPGMSRTQRDSLTKDLVRNLVFEDKEPFSVLDFESALKS